MGRLGLVLGSRLGLGLRVRVRVRALIAAGPALAPGMNAGDKVSMQVRVMTGLGLWSALR